MSVREEKKLKQKFTIMLVCIVSVCFYFMNSFLMLLFFFSFAVKHLKIEKNTSQTARQFEPVTEKGKGDICAQYRFTFLV